MKWQKMHCEGKDKDKDNVLCGQKYDDYIMTQDEYDFLNDEDYQEDKCKKCLKILRKRVKNKS